jgi:cell division protein FtsB
VAGDTSFVRGYQAESEGLTVSLKEKVFFSMVFFVLFSIFVMAIFGEKGLVDFYRLKKEHAELIEANKEIARENKSFLNEINRLKNDLVYVESVARKDLGFVSKEEFIFQTKTAPVK